MPQNNDNSTTSTAVRYEYTNDLLAALLVVSTVGAVAGSLYLTGSVPRNLAAVFAFESLLAAGWAFGPETLRSVAEHFPNPYARPEPTPAASSTTSATGDDQGDESSSA